MKNIVLFSAVCLSCFNTANTYTKNQFEVTIPLPADAPAYPPDVSFCIVDLKYNKPHLKICEFGQGAVSGFYGHQRLYGAGKIWKHLWDYLRTLKIPLIFMHGNPLDHHLLHSKSLYSIYNYRSLICPTFKDFFKQYKKQLPPCKKHTRSETQSILSLAECKGLFISNHSYLLFKNYNHIKEKCPDHLILDDATRQFVLSKLFTHLLFMDDTELQAYRPKCKIISRSYVPGMAKKIIDELKSEHYIIKPTNAFKGRGLIFVSKNDLEQTLKTILDPEMHVEKHERQEFRYWAGRRNNFFIIESLESSQPITVAGKNYDATMRVAFAMSYDYKAISIRILDAYWKLPDKAINDHCTLSESKKSHIRHGHICSARVEPETFAGVAQTLLKILPKVYKKMITIRNNPTLVPPEYAQAAIAFSQISQNANF